MGCKYAGNYWKQARLPHSIYCLKNALPGTLSDPQKHDNAFFLFLTLMNFSLVLQLIFTRQAPQTLAICPSGVGCSSEAQTIRLQGASPRLACKLNGREPLCPTFPLDIYLSGCSEGRACPVCLLTVPGAAFAQWTSSKEGA